MTNLITQAKIAFCSITKEDGHSNGSHLLGVYVNKKFKKAFEADFDSVWEENKTKKAKKPVYDSSEWFSKDDDGNLVFWIKKDAGSEFGIKLQKEEGSDFKKSDFGKIGAGSIADVSYDLYYYNHPKYGEMVLRAIKAVKLIDLVPYTDDGGVGGDSVEDDTESKKSDEDGDGEVKTKKSKKDKKKKKNKGKK